MQTTLNLLTRNGVVFMAFKPALNADQYAELLVIARKAEDEKELRTEVGSFAGRENLAVCFDQ